MLGGDQLRNRVIGLGILRRTVVGKRQRAFLEAGKGRDKPDVVVEMIDRADDLVIVVAGPLEEVGNRAFESICEPSEGTAKIVERFEPGKLTGKGLRAHDGSIEIGSNPVLLERWDANRERAGFGLEQLQM